MKESLALKFQRDGFRFVPLVFSGWFLHCSLSILFLRRDGPNSVVISAGDLDNRLKTLIDALRMPTNASELGGASPEAGQDPFYVLLENDNQVNSLSAETDVLLGGSADPTEVSLYITVDIRPSYTENFNVGFS
jgi:hypothetical protein